MTRKGAYRHKNLTAIQTRGLGVDPYALSTPSPILMKWCTGPCGRELPLSAFYTYYDPRIKGGQGKVYRQGLCKGCNRVSAREWYRRSYRNCPAFARKERRRARNRRTGVSGSL